MRTLLEIRPTKEISYEMPDEVFTIFHDLIKKTMAIHAPMSFKIVYNGLPKELQQKITVVETERLTNDVRNFELISIVREEVENVENNN